MENELRVGTRKTLEYIVEPGMLASDVGSGDANVLATPVLVNLVENFSFNLIKDNIDDSTLTSVGTSISIKHIAPTPIGMKILIKLTVMCVDRRVITFRVDLYDEVECIGSCVHERVIVDREKFNNKAANKKLN